MAIKERNPYLSQTLENIQHPLERRLAESLVAVKECIEQIENLVDEHQLAEPEKGIYTRLARELFDHYEQDIVQGNKSQAVAHLISFRKKAKWSIGQAKFRLEEHQKLSFFERCVQPLLNGLIFAMNELIKLFSTDKKYQLNYFSSPGEKTKQSLDRIWTSALEQVNIAIRSLAPKI